MANSGWSWHLFAAPAVWIAKLKGRPVVLHYHGGEAEAFFKRSFFWVKPSLKQASAILLPSNFLDPAFRMRGFSTIVVPNIVDLSRFSPKKFNRGYSLCCEGHPHIVVTRNLERIYDNASALRAFRIIKDQVPSARFTIAGSGPERECLEKLAEELGLGGTVTFTGRLNNEEMPSLYRSADIVVNPSLVDNMPVSILEAMASGVPVVSTRIGGIPFIIQDGSTGLLVPSREPSAIANAVTRLIRDPALARRLADTALNAVQQYSWERVRDRLLKIYGSVLGTTSAVFTKGHE
jgi:glycosyltransferase involved in cell wall biosynthesis